MDQIDWVYAGSSAITARIIIPALHEILNNPEPEMIGNWAGFGVCPVDLEASVEPYRGQDGRVIGRWRWFVYENLDHLDDRGTYHRNKTIFHHPRVDEDYPQLLAKGEAPTAAEAHTEVQAELVNLVAHARRHLFEEYSARSEELERERSDEFTVDVKSLTGLHPLPPTPQM